MVHKARLLPKSVDDELKSKVRTLTKIGLVYHMFLRDLVSCEWSLMVAVVVESGDVVCVE